MDQQEHQQLISEIKYYQELLEQVERSLDNLARTKKAILEFDEEPSKDFLAPIANGVYVEAELKSKKLLVNIGSDVVSSKSVAETISVLENQEKEVLLDKEKVIKKIESCYSLLEENNKGV